MDHDVTFGLERPAILAEVSSGNVFADIGMSEPELERLLAEVRMDLIDIAGGAHSPDTPDRIGFWMFTFTGRFFPLDPRPHEIRIADIAHALAMQCRFNGSCKRFLSVAEHSVWASFIGPEDEALERLLHDAAETWIGDWIRPLKLLPGLAGSYKRIERALEIAVALRFGLRFPFPPSVKHADEAVCTAEIELNIAYPNKGHMHVPTKALVDGEPLDFAYLDPVAAEQFFLARFRSLAAQRGLDPETC